MSDKTLSHWEWEEGGGKQSPFRTLWEIKGKCWFRPAQLSNNFIHKKFNIHNIISLLLITIITQSLIRERKYLLHSVIIMEIFKNHQFPWPTLNDLSPWCFLCISPSPRFKRQHLQDHSQHLQPWTYSLELKNAPLHRFIKSHQLTVTTTIDVLHPVSLANVWLI